MNFSLSGVQNQSAKEGSKVQARGSRSRVLSSERISNDLQACGISGTKECISSRNDLANIVPCNFAVCKCIGLYWQKEMSRSPTTLTVVNSKQQRMIHRFHWRVESAYHPVSSTVKTSADQGIIQTWLEFYICSCVSTVAGSDRYFRESWTTPTVKLNLPCYLVGTVCESRIYANVHVMLPRTFMGCFRTTGSERRDLPLVQVKILDLHIHQCFAWKRTSHREKKKRRLE